MKSATLAVLCVLAILPVAYGLKCYNCIGTEDACSKSKLEEQKDSKLSTCAGGMCMRMWAKGDGDAGIINSCSSSILCEAAKKACEDGKGEGDCAVGCCDTDGCNAGSAVSISVFLMTMCSVLGLILLK